MDNLDEYLFSTDLNDSLFIVGDININLLNVNKQDNNLTNFMYGLGLKNYVLEPTRSVTKYYQKSKSFKNSSTLIDVFLHNNFFKVSCKTVDCPFSDHKFVIANIDLPQLDDLQVDNLIENRIETRNLSNSNIIKIIDYFRDIKININEYESVDEKWEILKSNLLNSINTVAPFKISKRIKKCEKYPWIDMELLDIKQKRDWYYKLSRKNKNLESSDYIMFIEFKKVFKKVNDEKLISYFKDKTLKDFKCTKKFYQFYSSVYTVKSDKSSLTIPFTISDGELTKSNPKEISNFINKYFININSELKCSLNNFDVFCSYNFP